jgi:CLN3 protein
MSLLWLTPSLQAGNLATFWYMATYQVFYNYFPLIPAFYVGLLGGGVYINCYTRMDLHVEHREFALSNTSVAGGLSIVCADIAGRYLQACLYPIHAIKGALVSCPLSHP